MTKRFSRLLPALLFAALIGIQAVESAYADPVAMVTDMQGKIASQASPRKGDFTILTAIDAGTRVQVDAGVRLVVIYLKGGDEYTFSGPALVEFKVDEPVALSGTKPEMR